MMPLLVGHTGAGHCRTRPWTQARQAIELHRRFAIAIDAAAMRDGADSTDDYLAEWRRGEPVECGEDLEAEAAHRAAALEAEYPAERVKSLVDNGGREPG